MRKPQPIQPHIPTQIERIAYRICRFAYGHKACTCAKYARVPCARAEEIAESIIRTVLAEPKAYRSEVKR